MKKPTLSFWQIWNVSFGFLGIQIGYSLQSGNTSRILSALGSSPEHLSYFWLAAPIAGLIVQPIVGLSSDRTWTKLGRRIPFILGGAIISAIAMFFMPNAEIVTHWMPPVFFGACMLLFMDCSFNISMQPFRALVGDMVGEKQRNLGYSTQSFLTTIGGVIGSFLPFVITHLYVISDRLSVPNSPIGNEKIAASLIWSYYIGGTILLLTVLWTSFKVKEYPPKEYAEYNNLELSTGEKTSFLETLRKTPPTMFQLAIVQFFSWFALFIMWVYATNGIAENVWHNLDPHSQAFNDAADWNGLLCGVYGIFGALFSIVMAKIANKVGRKKVYSAALLMGAIGLISMYFIHDKFILIFSMLGVGIAWAGILAMPYAILSGCLPASKMGVYMGIFNATITIPQIAAGLLGSLLFTKLAGGSNIMMLVVAGVSMAIAAVSVFCIKADKNEIINSSTH